ncbi:hypothetical protein H8356DRAFT_1334712 [Neocallimastix lanati (nom. inval.)]|nr:hypothetical protein H8356DRAFT_1334712 [Neocallimastix sp. JGI-2020a]
MEKIFHRGSCCYGTSTDNTKNLFVLGAKKFKDNILSMNTITKFNDSFFRFKYNAYLAFIFTISTDN